MSASCSKRSGTGATLRRVSRARRLRARPGSTVLGVSEDEVLDALPVLAEAAERSCLRTRRTIRWRSSNAASTVIPAVQAAAVAAGGFVAGAAVVGLVHRRRRARRCSPRAHAPAPSRGAGALARIGRAGELLQIVGSRSLLLDVHLLGGSRRSLRRRLRALVELRQEVAPAGPFRLPRRDGHGRNAAPPRRRARTPAAPRRGAGAA